MGFGSGFAGASSASTFEIGSDSVSHEIGLCIGLFNPEEHEGLIWMNLAFASVFVKFVTSLLLFCYTHKCARNNFSQYATVCIYIGL